MAPAALSLRCNTCSHPLYSSEEAQQHAELTGHVDFSESTEPVLNMTCKECGKPCRTQTEMDLHTKRTGHAEFEDRTSETAMQVDVAKEVEQTAAAGGVGGAAAAGSGGGEDGGEGGEMVVPEVSAELKAELQGMGFSEARSVRALHFSGNSSVEAAVNWIVEHEEDADIDSMPLVPKSQAGPPQPSLTPEEARAKAEELRLRAKKKREEEEKRLEREREKERIRAGKELLQAKQLEEAAERKRIIALRKAEKEEEKRAREKIKARIEEDRLERRRRLGLPPEEPKGEGSEGQQQQHEGEEKKTVSAAPSSHLPVRPASKAERMRSVLRSLKQHHKDQDDKVKRAFQTLLTYVTNAATKDDPKFRKIRLSNAAFQERVGCFPESHEFLGLCGFEKGVEEDFLVLQNVDKVVLNTAGSELSSAITNPFFGAL